MKNDIYERAKPKFLAPSDPKQKKYEAIRFVVVENGSIESAAAKFGYKKSTMKTLLSQFLNGHSEAFPATARKPKGKKIPDSLSTDIVKLRNDGLSAQDISMKLQNIDVNVSVRTVERELKILGFPKLSRRTNEALGITKNKTTIPEVAENIKLDECEPFSVDCPIAGIFFFIPYIIESGILDIMDKVPLPESSVIGSKQACLSILLFKLIGGERLSQVQSLDHEMGLGIFAGLNILPKSTYMSTYSCRCSEEILMDFQKEVVSKLISIYPNFYSSKIVNLDFHSIPHFGDESEMEKVWCGARGKTMKGANSVIAHDSGSNAIMYTRADILRKEEPEEIKKFIAYWKGIKGKVEETLVFDCKFTTYKILDEISEEVKFITLRKRNESLIQATENIPKEDWARVYLPIPKRKRKHVSVYEERVTLSGCKNEFRQITIKNHGRANPTYIILNDDLISTKEVLILYAKRWHVEQKIAEMVSFFNLNALSSPLMIRIHFDVIWTTIADTLYHVFAQDLRRFEKSLSPSIFKKFINMPGKVSYDGERFTLKIRKRAHTPVLLGVSKLCEAFSIPWLDGKSMKIEWTA